MARKPKRLNITKDDRVVGLQDREKRDLFASCNEPGKPWFNRDDHEFMKSFCRICKNADCVRARGAVSPWHTRMAEQVDYLLNDPEFSDLTTSPHKDLAQMAFDDISQKALRLEVARQRQDWNIPDAPTDGVDKVAAPETTDQFDDAVRALAEAKGKKVPTLGRSEQPDSPAHFQQPDDPPAVAPEPPAGEESEWEYDTRYPSSDGSRTYHVTLSKKGAWACECDGFVHRQKCKHLNTVRAWYEDQLVQAEEQERLNAEERARQEAARRSAPTQDPRVPDSRYNTPMPQGGVMIGGGMAPPDSRQAPPPEPEDPWAPREDKATVVKPGAVVTLKGGKKKDD
jgi:hypothetical protein